MSNAILFPLLPRLLLAFSILNMSAAAIVIARTVEIYYTYLEAVLEYLSRAWFSFQ